MSKKIYHLKTSKRSVQVCFDELPDKVKMSIDSNLGEYGDEIELMKQLFPLILIYENDNRPLEIENKIWGQTVLVDKDIHGEPFVTIKTELRQ